MKYIIAILIFLVACYSLLWYLSMKKYQVEYGISFNQDHATSLGLEWPEVYQDMLFTIKPKYIRIAAMWSDIQEKSKNEYDFSNIDWMMDKAEEAGAKVVLVVGQKAPRWPECHVPEWIKNYGKEDFEKDLFEYVTKTVSRYKDHPALEIWQVENEPFIRFEFGDCEFYREDLVEPEINLVKSLDKNHPIILTDSGELSTWKKAIKMGDYFGTTLYRVVRTPKGRVFTYDWLPAGFYKLKAKIWGQDLRTMFVSELQAEPWFTDAGAKDTPIEIQEETMSIERLHKHFDYVERIGVPRAYLWGVEWWYYMKEKNGDSRYVDAVKEKIEASNIEPLNDL